MQPSDHPSQTNPSSLIIKILDERTKEKRRDETPIPGLVLHRWGHPTEPSSYLFTPHLCLIAQGVKRIILGDEAYVYDDRTYVVSSVELPIISQIIEATPAKPYLGLTLELDLQEISRIMLNGSSTAPAASPTDRGIGVSRLTPTLLSAVERLLSLLNTPEDIPIFHPLIRQEIYHRLLMGAQGGRLRQIVRAESRSSRIAKAIDHMKKHFDRTLSVQTLSGMAGMSPSSFHQHFRALTAITPLQFQKRIQLTEARRLMLLEQMDAGTAAFHVGYESPTQFTREYKRMFGNPPKTDIKKLQEEQLLLQP